MKLFLDDQRSPPKNFIHVKTFQECIDHLVNNEVEVLSLDHDLGEEKTGYDVAQWISEKAITTDWKPPKLIVLHSMNPVGVKNMMVALDQILKHKGNLFLMDVTSNHHRYDYDYLLETMKEEK